MFCNTTAHANADALSRLPLPVLPAKTELEPELLLLAEHLAEAPVTADDIRGWTRRDPELARDLQFLQQRWPRQVKEDVEQYSPNAWSYLYMRNAFYGDPELLCHGLGEKLCCRNYTRVTLE